VSTYHVTSCTVPVGVRGFSVRLGRALENWGSEPATPIDLTALRLELRRQDEVKTRMISDRVTLGHW
jgi:hypothetical protein